MVSMEEVLDFFAKGYNLPKGVEVSAERYCDPFKRVVIFKFIADNEAADFDEIKARPRVEIA